MNQSMIYRQILSDWMDKWVKYITIWPSTVHKLSATVNKCLGQYFYFCLLFELWSNFSFTSQPHETFSQCWLNVGTTLKQLLWFIVFESHLPSSKSKAISRQCHYRDRFISTQNFLNALLNIRNLYSTPTYNLSPIYLPIFHVTPAYCQ